MVDLLDVAEAMLDGELEYRKGNYDIAFAHLRRSVELSDGLPYDEPWGWMQPARHALGALLLEQGRIEEAEAVYRSDLGLDGKLSRACQHPDNLWSLHGLHECLVRRGEKAEIALIKQRLDLAQARAEVRSRRPASAGGWTWRRRSGFARLIAAEHRSSDCRAAVSGRTNIGRVRMAFARKVYCRVKGVNLSIFGLIEKLLAGDQNAAPADARLERDAQGRVVSISQTISSLPGSKPAVHPRLVLREDLRPRLREARDWLKQRNISLARTHGIGLEETFVFDQDEGTLELIFSDGRKIIARSQILGSFDPQDRSFLWAWANPSTLPEMATVAKHLQARGLRTGDAALTTPIQTASFEEVTALLAMFTQECEVDGLYRCAVNDCTSVFVAFRVEAHLLPDGTRVDASGFFDNRASDELLASAGVLAKSYHQAMLAFDRAFHERGGHKRGGNGFEIMDELNAEKLKVCERYWSRADESSTTRFGWPSDHDATVTRARFTAPHVLGGAIDVSIGPMVRKTIYRLESVGGALKLTDHLTEWGDGLLWPDAPEAR